MIQSATLTEAPLTAAGLDGTGQIIQVICFKETPIYLGVDVRRQQTVNRTLQAGHLNMPIDAVYKTARLLLIYYPRVCAATLGQRQNFRYLPEY